MNRKKFILSGGILVVLGIGCLASSYQLQRSNSAEDQEAGIYSDEAVDEIDNYLLNMTVKDDEYRELEEENEGIQEKFEIVELQVEEVSYMGTLEIPTLNLRLPIQTELTDDALKKTPCRLQGNMVSGNLIIGAHNYKTHFGYLNTLEVGDMAYITDLKGVVYTYQLEHLEILHQTDVEELIIGNPNLTLFTCNYDNRQRVVARFKQIL